MTAKRIHGAILTKTYQATDCGRGWHTFTQNVADIFQGEIAVLVIPGGPKLLVTKRPEWVSCLTCLRLEKQNAERI